jgi:6-phosphogluconolactonase
LIEAGIRDGHYRTIALTGGTTPRGCYELLATRPIEWGRVTVLFGDERCVAPEDSESNFRMAFETLLSKVFPASVHRVAGELGAEAAAADYDRVLRSLGGLDLVLLGLGEDGHTASLFPGHRELHAEGLVTPVHHAPKPPSDRVSLTLNAINSAHHVVFLATGHAKREAFSRAVRGSPDVPAGMVRNPTWIVDAAVAS